MDCSGTHKVDPDKLAAAVREIFHLTPRGIIESLNLRKPIYTPTAYHGHFGRVPEGDLFTWEKTDKVEALKNALTSAAVTS
jgi:S-adenosylmethionine synthetase